MDTEINNGNEIENAPKPVKKKVTKLKPRLNQTPYKITPYCLGYLDFLDFIAVRCDERLFPSLRAFSGVYEHNDPTIGKWFAVPASKENALCLEALCIPEFVGDEYITWRNSIMDIPTDWAKSAEIWCNVQRELKPHQLQFIELAHDKIGMFNGSQQGTGKTTPAFILMRSLGASRILVLANKTLLNEWIREQKKIWQNPPFEIVDLVNDSVANRIRLMQEIISSPLKPKQIAIVNYEAVWDMAEVLSMWEPQMMFLDESWRVKNPHAKMTIAAMALSEIIPQKIPMSGTIVGNHIGDLWSQLYIINPDILGGLGYDEFLERYATFRPINTTRGARKVPNGISDPAGLMKLLAPVLFRATKAICSSLPPKDYEVVTVPLSKECMELYKKVKDEGIAALGGEELALSLEGDRVVRLRLHQIAGGFKPVPTEELRNGKRVWIVEPLPCAKLNWLLQWAEDHVPEDSQIRTIIWVKFNAEGNRIKLALDKIYGVDAAQFAHGGTKESDLEDWKDSFNSRNPKGIMFLVMQIQGNCSGHNLPAGDHHIFFSNSYSYIYRSQAEERSDRIDREGNPDNSAITVWDILCEKTIDIEIYDTLKRKESLSDRLTPATVSDTIGEETTPDEV